MSPITELEQLLHDRFAVTVPDFVAALREQPAARPGLATLTEHEAELLDTAGFAEDPGALLTSGADTAGEAARLAVAAFTAAEVAAGLGISASRVRQRRLARELWALPDGRSWVFPVPQFETDDSGAPRRVVRGLERVIAALPADLHPLAVAGFLATPQPCLYRDGAMTPLEWLRSGGVIDEAVAAVGAVDWYTA